MKTKLRHLLTGIVLAGVGALLPAAIAQSPASSQTDQNSAVSNPAPSPVLAASTTSTTNAALPSATEPTSQPSTVAQPQRVRAPAPAASPSSKPVATSPDTPPSPSETDSDRSGATAPVTAKPAKTSSAESAGKEHPSAGPTEKHGAASGRKNRPFRWNDFGYVPNDNACVGIGQDAYLAKGKSAQAVVAVLGNATSEGRVSGAVVAVLGNARATGPTSDSVVGVLGNVYVDSEVGNVVSVLGNVELGPHAVVHGNLVHVGGNLTRDPKAIVYGNTPEVGISAIPFHSLDWLHDWIRECLLKGRLLSFGPNMGWAWFIALGALTLYLLVALAFRGAVDKCVTTLETRPGGSILAAILTLLLIPVLIVLLIITVIGIAVVPFLGIALFCASILGRVTMLAWLGRRITRHFGDGPLGHPAFAVLIGGIIVLLLYIVPVVGIIIAKTFGVLGLGVVVHAILLSKRGKPAPLPAIATAGVASGVSATAAVAPSAGTGSEPAGGGIATETAVAATPSAPAAGSTLPRAGFWIRLVALIVDMILVGVLVAVCNEVFPRPLHIHMPGGLLPVLGIYGAVLWKLRGSTIGGIVFGLKVIRLDDRPIDWATAIVRALGCFLSLIVVGLGFIWAGIDDEKQSWHDKIAGTTVVYSRGNLSLV